MKVNFLNNFIVFTWSPGQYKPDEGPYLGEFKDESLDGWEIVEFLAIAPKCYLYKLKKINSNEVKVISKTKGVKVNHATKEILTAENFEAALYDNAQFQCPQLTFRRNKYESTVQTNSTENFFYTCTN